MKKRLFVEELCECLKQLKFETFYSWNIGREQNGNVCVCRVFSNVPIRFIPQSVWMLLVLEYGFGKFLHRTECPISRQEYSKKGLGEGKSGHQVWGTFLSKTPHYAEALHASLCGNPHPLVFEQCWKCLFIKRSGEEWIVSAYEFLVEYTSDLLDKHKSTLASYFWWTCFPKVYRSCAFFPAIIFHCLPEFFDVMSPEKSNAKIASLSTTDDIRMSGDDLTFYEPCKFDFAKGTVAASCDAHYTYIGLSLRWY